jgi:uncharacterized lipoprotein YajG
MKKFIAALLTLAALALLTACADWSEAKMGIKVIPCNVPSQKGCK